MMDPSNPDTSMLPGAVALRAFRFVRRLTLFYAGCAVAAALPLALAFWPGDGIAPVQMLVADALHGGLAALVLASLLLAVTALSGALLVATSRQHSLREAALSGDADRPALDRFLSRFPPSVMARQGQAIAMSVGAIAIWGTCWLFSYNLTFEPLSPNANLAAGFAIFLAFPSLIAERMMRGFPAVQMPEAPALHRILLLATILLGLAGCLEIGRDVGLVWLQWPIRIFLWLPALVAIELCLRALGRLFMPPPADAQARAATDSMLLTLITAGPGAPGVLLREHLGLDFARSWALSYLRTAALPAILLTALFCWCLSGLKLIAYDERGVYERLGAPVGVLGPGLHLLLPWPVGILHPVEYGRVHTIVAGLNHAAENMESIGAEATAPASANRLWETLNPTEVEYLVASQTSSQQGFQAVSAEIRVLYRIGLTDGDALASVYSSDDPEALVKSASSRLATFYFSSHTLDDVMGARRDTLEETMRTDLARDLRSENAGIEIVAVVIQAIHPPAGAAGAYHAVQAAEINADASIFDETARAEHTLGTAQQEATQTLDAAQAHALEITQRANGDAYTFAADVKANSLAPAAFLLERRFGNLTTAFASRHLIIMDSRLTPAQEPVIDMRPNLQGNMAADQTAPTPSPPEATPGTSTEGVAPPMTSEQAAEDARKVRKAGASR